MKSLRILLAVLSFLVLAAHFLRDGRLAIALPIALVPLLLLLRRTWGVRVVQAGLALGVVVWLSTLASIAASRRERGLPYARMALILGAVAVVTAGSAVALQGLLPRGGPRDSSPK